MAIVSPAPGPQHERALSPKDVPREGQQRCSSPREEHPSAVRHPTGNVADVALADRDELVLGLLAAPELPTEVAEALAEDLPGLLADRVTDAVSWRVPVRTDPAVADMGHGVEA